jgi:methylated-DNA-[protein]-cysteine S-methyltransferase
MTQPIYQAYYQSEIGLIHIMGTAAGISSLNFVETKNCDKFGDQPLLQACVEQLDEYFNGKRKVFSVSLAPAGTAFQQQVWQTLLNIPYGQTVSYLEIARAIGNEQAVRAVGSANGQNPIAIIIPCHRVIGSNGKLTGYGGGLWRKAWLLKHEQNFAVGKQMSLF